MDRLSIFIILIVLISGIVATVHFYKVESTDLIGFFVSEAIDQVNDSSISNQTLILDIAETPLPSNFTLKINATHKIEFNKTVNNVTLWGVAPKWMPAGDRFTFGLLVLDENNQNVHDPSIPYLGYIFPNLMRNPGICLADKNESITLDYAYPQIVGLLNATEGKTISIKYPLRGVIPTADIGGNLVYKIKFDSFFPVEFNFPKQAKIVSETRKDYTIDGNRPFYDYKMFEYDITLSIKNTE